MDVEVVFILATVFYDVTKLLLQVRTAQGDMWRKSAGVSTFV